MTYQKQMIVVPGENDSTVAFDYDWKSYFALALSDKKPELAAESGKIRLFAENVPEDWVCPVCGLGKDAFEKE